MRLTTSFIPKLLFKNINHCFRCGCDWDPACYPESCLLKVWWSDKGTLEKEWVGPNRKLGLWSISSFVFLSSSHCHVVSSLVAPHAPHREVLPPQTQRQQTNDWTETSGKWGWIKPPPPKLLDSTVSSQWEKLRREYTLFWRSDQSFHHFSIYSVQFYYSKGIPICAM